MSEVEYRDRTIKDPKELAEVQDAIEGITDAMLNGGKNKWALVMAQLPKGMKAADGLEQVKVEVKDDAVYESMGAFSGRMTKMIVKKAGADPTPDDVAGEQPAATDG